MTAQRDPDSLLAAWLDEGPTELPDATRRAIVTALPTTPQARRGLRAPWRFPTMNVLAKTMLGLAAVLVVAFGGITLLGGRSDTGAPAPSISPSPSPLATPRQLGTPMPEPPLGGTFNSPLYHYVVHYPSAWKVSPATRLWTKTINSGADIPYWGDAALDTLQGTDVRLVVWGQPIPQAQGVTQAQAVDLWVRNLHIGSGPCVADSQLPASFPVGQAQAFAIINGCGPAPDQVKDSVLYEVAVVLNGVGWDFTFDGRVDAPYVQAVLDSVTVTGPQPS